MNKTFKKFFCIFLILTLTLPLFTACGNDKEDAFSKLSPMQKVYQGKSNITASLSDILKKTAGIENEAGFEAGDFSSSRFDMAVNKLIVDGNDIDLDLGLNAEVLVDAKNQLSSLNGKLSALGDTIKLSVQSDNESIFIGSDGLLPKPLYISTEYVKELTLGGSVAGSVALTSMFPALKDVFTDENIKHLKDLVVSAIPEEIFSESQQEITLTFAEGEKIKTTCVSAVIDGTTFTSMLKSLLNSVKTDSVVKEMVQNLLPLFKFSDESFDLASSIDEIIAELEENMNDEDSEMEDTLTINCYYNKGSLVRVEVFFTDLPAENQDKNPEEAFKITVDGNCKENKSFVYTSVVTEGETVFTLDGNANETTSTLTANLKQEDQMIKFNLGGNYGGDANDIELKVEVSEDGEPFEELLKLNASLKTELVNNKELKFDGNFVLKVEDFDLDFDLNLETKTLDEVSITLPSKDDACDISDTNQLQSTLMVLLMNMQTKLPNIVGALGGA